MASIDDAETSDPADQVTGASLVSGAMPTTVDSSLDTSMEEVDTSHEVDTSVEEEDDAVNASTDSSSPDADTSSGDGSNEDSKDESNDEESSLEEEVVESSDDSDYEDEVIDDDGTDTEGTDEDAYEEVVVDENSKSHMSHTSLSVVEVEVSDDDEEEEVTEEPEDSAPVPTSDDRTTELVADGDKAVHLADADSKESSTAAAAAAAADAPALIHHDDVNAGDTDANKSKSKTDDLLFDALTAPMIQAAVVHTSSSSNEPVAVLSTSAKVNAEPTEDPRRSLDVPPTFESSIENVRQQEKDVMGAQAEALAASLEQDVAADKILHAAATNAPTTTLEQGVAADKFLHEYNDYAATEAADVGETNTIATAEALPAADHESNAISLEEHEQVAADKFLHDYNDFLATEATTDETVAVPADHNIVDSDTIAAAEEQPAASEKSKPEDENLAFAVEAADPPESTAKEEDGPDTMASTVAGMFGAAATAFADMIGTSAPNEDPENQQEESLAQTEAAASVDEPSSCGEAVPEDTSSAKASSVADPTLSLNQGGVSSDEAVRPLSVGTADMNDTQLHEAAAIGEADRHQLDESVGAAVDQDRSIEPLTKSEMRGIDPAFVAAPAIVAAAASAAVPQDAGGIEYGQQQPVDIDDEDDDSEIWNMDQAIPVARQADVAQDAGAYWQGDEHEVDEVEEAEGEGDADDSDELTDREEETVPQDDPEDLELGKVQPHDEIKDTSSGITSRKRWDTMDIILLIGIIIVILLLAIPLPIILKHRRDHAKTSPAVVPTAPTKIPYLLAAGPFAGDAKQGGLGFASSLFGDTAVAGAPQANSNSGSVTTYSLHAGNWTQRNTLKGNQSGQMLGYSIDLRDGGMIAGAPGTFANGGGSAPVGAAYFYEFGQATKALSQLGSTIRGNIDVDSFGEMFGAAVASSGSTRTVVIGAPMRKSGSGGVYTFQYRSLGNGNATSDWLNLTAAPLVIGNLPERAHFGTSVAISPDGNTLIAGAPDWGGGRGYALVYDRNTTSGWSVAFEHAGETVGGSYGASVAFLDSQTFAVGEPNASSGVGIVRVYQRQGKSQFKQLGPNIEGNSTGAALGAAGTISGRVNGKGSPSILVASALGTVDRYEYDGTRWTTPYTTVSSLGGPVTSVDLGDTGDTFVAGVASANNVAFYSVKGSAAQPAASPVSTPTLSPSLRGNSMAPSGATSGGSMAPSAPVGGGSVAPSAATSGGSMAPSSMLTSSMAPSAVNISSIAPSMAPSAANVSTGQWAMVASFTGDGRLGSSVDIAPAAMAGGDRTSGNVKTYQRNGTSWAPASNLTANGTNTRFGSSLALNDDGTLLVVGAPDVYPVGSTAVTTGAVYTYHLQGGSWTQETELRGAEDIYSAGEQFGSAVAVSRSGSFLISGAPLNGAGGLTNRGRVYTFQGSTTGSANTFSKLTDAPLLGTASGDFFGSAVAVSSDGSTLVAGGPGGYSGNGYVSVYSFNGTSWGSPVSVLLGSTSGELLGQSVTILASDGSVFAAGAPNYSVGAGAVRIYKRQTGGSYAPLGSPILGTLSAAIGGVDGISGSVDNGIPVLLVASSDGVISTYQLNSTSWTQSLDPVSTGLLGSPVLRGSTGLGSFVAGSRNQVEIYSKS